MSIKCLTIWPEWAPSFTHMGKRVENRTWPPPSQLIGERFALHAGASWPGPNSDRWHNFKQTAIDAGFLVNQREKGVIEYVDLSFDEYAEDMRTIEVPVGCVFITCVLESVRHIDSFTEDELFSLDWAFGPWCWILGHLHRIPQPVPAKGHQGFWWVDL